MIRCLLNWNLRVPFTLSIIVDAMMIRSRKQKQRGISLIEVLIALLIFSIGLIGIASLLVMATSANHGAYLRTQVSYLAHNMADRMSANPMGVWNGDYNGTYPAAAGPSCASGCTAAQLAQHDAGIWSSQLTTLLPYQAGVSPLATIRCDNTDVGFVPSTDDMAKRPPYGGTCQMTIVWYDRGVGGTNNRQAAPETFAWEFQP